MEDTSDSTTSPAVDYGSMITLPDTLQGFATIYENRRYSLRLQFSVKEGSQDVVVIEGQRPRAKHLRSVNLSSLTTGDFLTLCERSSGTSSAVMDQLDAADAMRVVTLMGFFMGGGLGTGRT